MKLKRYIQFIKESNTEFDKIWKLDSDDILEFFIDFEDAGYSVNVEFGFQIEGDDEFTEKIYPGEMIPSYWIQIETKSKTTSEDLTGSLKFAIDIIADKLNTSHQLSLFQSSHENYPAKITLHDSDGEFPIKYLYDDLLKVKGGTFWKEGNDDYDYEFEKYTAIFIRQKESVNITPKMMADYYGWKYDHSDEKGNIYTDIELKDLADYLLENKSSYKDYLVDGMENMWDNYDLSNYYPDDNSLIQYTLDKENANLMVKSIIKEMGGLENTIGHIGDECDDDIYDKVKNMTEDELVDFLLDERFYNTLKQISNDSEVKNEIRQIVADWEMSAHVDDNYDSIVSSFDDVVGEEFEFNKIQKEVERSQKYPSNDSDGNSIIKVHTYKEEVTFYRIMFEDKWLGVTQNWDKDDMKKYVTDLSDLLTEYCGQEVYKHSLNPRISDWGSADNNKINKDIKFYLTKFISD